MDETFSIKNYNDVEKSNLIAFLNERIQWKADEDTFHNEFSFLKEKFIFKIAIKDNIVLATLAIKPFYIYFNGKKYLSGKFEYAQVEEVKGKRYYKILVENAIHEAESKKYKILTGRSSLLMTKIFHKHFGFQYFENIFSLLVLRIKVSPVFKGHSMFKGFYFNIKYFYFELKKKMFYVIHRGDINNIKFEISSMLKNDSDMYSFYKAYELRHKHKLKRLLYDEKFIHSTKKSNESMIIRYYYKNHILSGFLIAKIRNRDAILCDLLSLDLSDLKLMLFSFINELKQKNISKVIFMGNESSPDNFKIFKAMNYYKVIKFNFGKYNKNLSPFGYRILNGSREFVSHRELKIWHFNILW